MSINQSINQSEPLSEIMFNKFDQDKSGSIDSSEFHQLCFNLGNALTDTELQLALKVTHTNTNKNTQLVSTKTLERRRLAKSNQICSSCLILTSRRLISLISLISSFSFCLIRLLMMMAQVKLN